MIAMEGKEGIIVSVEEWVEIPDDIQELINNTMKDQGESLFVNSGEGVILTDTDIKRREKVISAIDFGMAKDLSERMKARRNLNPVTGFSTFEHEDRLVVTFNKLTSADDDSYNKGRTDILNQTNNILATFDQTPLPNYSSSNKKSL